VCVECVSESAWLAWCVHVSWHDSADFSLYWICSGFCCRSSVACWGSCPCSVPWSSLRTERACTCPSPKGWYRACRVRGSGCYHKFFVEAYCCFSGALVVWVIGSDRVGGLCLPWMQMMCDVSMFPSVRPPAFVSPGRMLLRMRVRILMFARPCARGGFCDASGAEAGFLPGRCCAASLCSISCWY